ncbi:GNAT family N-acetyltransferase [Catellatospora bangladeshensis]|uniref:Putative acetyltransferase n=1 Tax=Catellatospora bangladeshensis TaxID=310355 RepID=A0A8J3NQ03_9ACTN|nr:GNAT family N-acetyltransferase [Catellatospora bangladeshensis]GIF86510.1 putative acetyltransferase [Catellatospora bangladeshensis]
MKVTADTSLPDFAAAVMPWLLRDPVRNNQLLTMLQSRLDGVVPTEPDLLMLRVDDSLGALRAVAVRPPPFPMLLSDVSAGAVIRLGPHLARHRPEVRRFTGPAASTELLVARVAERSGAPASLLASYRMFQISVVRPPAGVAGHPREAALPDRDRLVEWSAAFQREALAEHPPSDPAAPIDGRLALGSLLWVWESGGEPVAMTAMTAPAAGVVRINLVYTPPPQRGNGYASALVAAVSRAALAARLRPVLFTDLANPTSNKIYRAIGYRPLQDTSLWEVG